MCRSLDAFIPKHIFLQKFIASNFDLSSCVVFKEKVSNSTKNDLENREGTESPSLTPSKSDSFLLQQVKNTPGSDSHESQDSSQDSRSSETEVSHTESGASVRQQCSDDSLVKNANSLSMDDESQDSKGSTNGEVPERNEPVSILQQKCCIV